MDKIFAVLLAGGASERMGFNKLLLPINGKSALERSLEAMLGSKNKPHRTVIAASGDCAQEAERLSRLYDGVTVAHGGATRGASARNALGMLYDDQGVVAIHDAARSLLSPEVFDSAVNSALAYGCGVAAIPVRDTLRDAEGNAVPREGLYAVQTPQAFNLARIRAAYEKAAKEGREYTDDLGVWLATGYPAHYSKGDIVNQKLTYPEDVAFFALASYKGARIGMGEDTHRLVEGRKLVLGGVEIPFEKGLLGHSDADALTHAVIDALLGAAALGDIGAHFPDTDGAYRDIRSLELLAQTARLIDAAGYTLGNIDATVTAQRPKLAPFIGQMRENIAETLGCGVAPVSVKATTTEGMNDEGRGLCITARAICMLNVK